MAQVTFTVTHRFDQPPPGRPQAVGAMFTGYTGYGPLTLVDHMRITEIEFDDTADLPEGEAGVDRDDGWCLQVVVPAGRASRR